MLTHGDLFHRQGQTRTEARRFLAWLKNERAYHLIRGVIWLFHNVVVDLVINRRSKPEGILHEDGRIQVGMTVSKTPSTAARLALAVGSVDGWLKWRVPRLDGKTLANVREGAS